VTNQQLYLSIGIPSVLVLLSWITSFVQSIRLDGKLESFRSEVATELRAIRSDINVLTRMYGEHGERIATLEAKKS
jgi:hypothetical protein